MPTEITRKAKKIPLGENKGIGITTKVGVAVRKAETIQDYLEFEEQMNKRHKELGGEQFFGPMQEKKGNIWYYQRGCLCYRDKEKKIYELHGEIYKKWKELHGPLWGLPDTDELPCADGTGRFNKFNGGSAYIYWSPGTGAHGVWGDNCRRYAELGFERSYLGYPVSSEVDFPDGGRVNAFQNGGIYWWSDTGAIDANDVAVQYTGLACFDETSEVSASDEPYVIMGVADLNGVKVHQSAIYEDVDAGDTRADLMEIYRGKPNGIIISVILMEHDETNPEKYRKEVESVMTSAHAAGTAALATIPIVGAGIAAVAGPLIQNYIPDIADAFNKWIGTGDDEIGRHNIVVTGKDMLLMAKRQQNSSFNDIGFKFTTNDLRGDDAHYKVYFGITAV